MAQLIVKDLDFCEIELSELKGGGWDLDVGADVAADALVDGPQVGVGLAAAGGAVAGANGSLLNVTVGTLIV